MKKKVIGVFVLAVILASCSDKGAVKLKEGQQVTVENVNGVQTVTVTTLKDGVEKKEVFKGAAGEAKLKELNKEAEKMNPEMSEKVAKEEKSKKIKMIDEDGKKSLTIEETKNGKTTKETYSGADADRKMKEIETEEESTRNIKIVEKEVIKE